MSTQGASTESDRITTGIDRLDDLLGGGIPRYSIVFIAGLPGTGKTILSQQALFANARLGRTCLYLSTISEPPIKVLRFLQKLGYFDQELFGRKVIYGDLGSPLRKGGPPELLRVLDQLVREHRPKLVVIDSFKALRDTLADPLAFREFTSDVAARLMAWEVTALLVGEYAADDLRQGPEFAIADGILYLYGTEEAAKQKRFLRVMKMRGTAFFAGAHMFDIGEGGITLYPRMDPHVIGEYGFPGRRTGSAIPGLNEMLAGGLYEATSTLISGGTGAGKTLVALSFLVDAGRRGIPGLLVSFEESPEQLVRNCEAFGWDLEGLLQRGLLSILHVSPSELDVDRHAFAIKERTESLGARLLVLDSISAFEAAVGDRARYQNYLWAINDFFKRQGVTVVLTAEVANPFAPMEITAAGISFLADNIIFLRYVEVEGETRHGVGVLKMRGSDHDTSLRELVIGPNEIAVAGRLSLPGLLGSSAHPAAGG